MNNGRNIKDTERSRHAFDPEKKAPTLTVGHIKFLIHNSRRVKLALPETAL